MGNNQIDLRIIKTRKNIEQSFMELLVEKPFEKITVQNIIEHALINRSTFYKHYNDKYAVAEQICEKIMKQLTSDLHTWANAAEHTLPSLVTTMYSHLHILNEHIFELYVIHTDTIHLKEDILTCFTEFFTNYLLDRNVDLFLVDFLSNLFATSLLNCIEWCFSNPLHPPVELCLAEMEPLLNQFVESITHITIGGIDTLKL